MIFSKLTELCNPQRSSCHLHLISALTTNLGNLLPVPINLHFSGHVRYVESYHMWSFTSGLYHYVFESYSCCIMHQHFVSVFIALIVSIVWIYHILLIHLPVGGLLDSSHLTLMSYATVQVFGCLFHFFWVNPYMWHY